MKETTNTITFMQNSLNRLMSSKDANCQSNRIYSLSVMLDKEIVRYYKNLTRARY